MWAWRYIAHQADSIIVKVASGCEVKGHHSYQSCTIARLAEQGAFFIKVSLKGKQQVLCQGLTTLLTYII